MHHIKTILILAIITSCTKSKLSSQNLPQTLVCYGKIDVTNIKGYKLLVLEESIYTKEDIEILKKNNTKVIAYLSLAEINADAKYYSYLKDYTLGKNNLWNSFHLDLSSAKLRNKLLTITNEIIEKGFDGLFLDNIDNACMFGPNPQFKDDLIGLIKEIREQNEAIYLVQNSGLEIIERTAKYINMVALESVITHYNFETKTYGLRDKTESNKRLINLNELVDKYQLHILLIEYANTLSLFNETKNLLIKSGYSHFIGNIDLQKVPEF